MNSLIIRLGLISFFADVSSEMLYPITPIFLTSVLGASMASVGLIEGCAEGIASLLKVHAGAWSDRIGKRKPFIFLGYLFAAVAKPFTGMATSWTQVLFARSFDRLGKGIRGAPRDAMLAESVSVEQRGQAFGFHRGMDTLGAALGPLIAIGYLASHQESLRFIYLWALVPGVISAGIALTLKDTPLKENREEAILKKEPIQWHWNLFSPSFRKYLVAYTLFSITNSSDVFLIMKARDSGASLSLSVLMYCFYNLVYAGLSPLLGKWSDHIPRKKIMGAGFLVFAAVYLGFSMVSELWQFWLLFGVYGIYMAATDGVGKAMAVDFFDLRLKATAVGILGTATGLATIIASTVAGLIWDQWGSSWAFIYGAVGAVIAALLLIWV